MRDQNLFGPIHATLPSHRKTQRLARRLSIPVPAVVGGLVCLWCRVLTEAPDGSLDGWDDDDIAGTFGWDGDAAVLRQALIVTGWLDEVDGVLVCHDWGDYFGHKLNFRAKDAARKRGERAKRRGRSDQAQTLPSTDIQGRTADVQGNTDDVRVEKEKEKEKEKEGESAALSTGVRGSPRTLPPPPDQVGLRNRRTGGWKHNDAIGVPWPKDADAALAWPYDGATLGAAIAQRFPMFPTAGIGSARAIVEGLLAHYRTRDGGPPPWPQPAITWIVEKLTEAHAKAAKNASASTWASKASGERDTDAEIAAARRALGDP